ncbi:MAG: alpha/beta fold hydrolase, partial [Bacteroidales bacterium]|nr:alpha/beta fold hydrolase [Bacteroidales bacterium]
MKNEAMELYYKKLGEGKPLLILHGLYGSSDNWYTVAKYLSSDYCVVTPDLRNHGHSPHTSSHTFNDMVADIYELLVQLGLTNVHLMGHSMGGKVAMLFAYRYPNFIDKLIIVDIAPREYTSLREPNDHVLQHLNIIQAYDAVDPAVYSSRVEVEKEFSQYITDERIRQFLLKNLARGENGTFRWLINVEALKNNMHGLMGKINIPNNAQIYTPTLFIKGERSNYLL